jgi:hypothetical protein
MKTQITKKISALVTVMTFFFSIIFFNNSCQKEISANAIKEDDTFKTNGSLIPQIVYTDINPDNILNATGSACNLDINNDGISDYTITNNLTSIKLSCLGRNEVLLDSIYHSPGAALPLNKIIGSNSTIWQDTSGIMTYTLSKIGGCGPTGNHYQGGCKSYYAQSPWGSKYNSIPTEAYLGFRIYVGVNIYFAWARVKVAVSNPFANHLTITIEDYAYNSNVNQLILAGQTQ